MPSRLEVTTPSEREIRVTRTFDAPADLVFECHTKPEYLKKWLSGPSAGACPSASRLRVGGRYRYVWRDDTDGNEFGVQGEFRQIDRRERIVHMESMDGVPGEALCTTTFEESGPQTRFTLTMLFESREVRDGALESGMTEGMSMSYDRMEDLIGKGHARDKPHFRANGDRRRSTRRGQLGRPSRGQPRVRSGLARRQRVRQRALRLDTLYDVPCGPSRRGPRTLAAPLHEHPRRQDRLGILVVSGAGQALAAAFDINRPLHGLAVCSARRLADRGAVDEHNARAHAAVAAWNRRAAVERNATWLVVVARSRASPCSSRPSCTPAVTFRPTASRYRSERFSDGRHRAGGYANRLLVCLLRVDGARRMGHSSISGRPVSSSACTSIDPRSNTRCSCRKTVLSIFPSRAQLDELGPLRLDQLTLRLAKKCGRARGLR